MISIITSLYRSEDDLADFCHHVKDVHEKADVELEHIIISNDPTDKEKHLLSKHSAFDWVSVSRVGQESLYASWNRGVKKANTNHITFWNVDDVRYPKALEDGIKRLEASANLVYFPFIYKRYITLFGWDIIVKRWKVDPPEFDKDTFTSGMHCGPFFMLKKSFWQEVGPFDESFKIAGDFEWCVRAAKTGNFEKSPVVAGEFRKDSGGLSGGENPLQEKENKRIYKKYGIRK